MTTSSTASGCGFDPEPPDDLAWLANFAPRGGVHHQYCRKILLAEFPGIAAPFLVESTWRRISSPCHPRGSWRCRMLCTGSGLGQGTRRNISSRFSSSSSLPLHLLLLPRGPLPMQPASSRCSSSLFVFLALFLYPYRSPYRSYRSRSERLQ